MAYKPQADAIIDGTIVLADLASSLIDQAAGTASLRTLGTAATQAAQGSAAEYTSNKGAASGYASLNSSTLVPTGQLGTGTADSTKFLRGDSTWQTPTVTPTYSTSSKTANYTITGTDDVILADAAGGAITITLPTAVSVTKFFTIKRKNSGANNVTVATTASQTIDGATTKVLAQQYESITVVSDNANWFII